MLSVEMIEKLISLNWFSYYIKNSIKRSKGNRLHEAVKKGDVENVISLINSGINLNKQNNNLETALHWAIMLKNDEITNILLDNNIEVNLKDINQNTSLHLAVLNGNYNIVKRLIKKGANLNIRNDEGKTALHIAVCSDRTDIAKLLIEAGAKYRIKDNSGQDVYDLSRNNQDVQNLIAHKEKLNNRLSKKHIQLLSKPDISEDTTKIYAKIKQGKLVDLNNINADTLNELIKMYTYFEQDMYKKVSPVTKEITQEDISNLPKDVPICIRGIRGISGIVPDMDNLDVQYNETGAELEIRKLVREKGHFTRTKLEGTKDGNINRCFTMINYGKIVPFVNVGYGTIVEDIENIKVASNRNLYSFERKEEGILDTCTELVYSDGKNKSIQDRVAKLLRNNKKVSTVKTHNELIMDVKEKDVRFIYVCANNDISPDYENLKAVYFRRKYQEKTGRNLPIFEYRVGKKEFLKQVDIKEEQIVGMLERELGVSNNGRILVNKRYFYPQMADFLITFKEEIKNSQSLKNFVNIWINYNTKNMPKDIYSIINIARIKGEFIGKDEQQVYLQKEVLNELKSGNLTKFVEEKTATKDKILLVNLKETKVDTKHRRINIELDFWFYTLAQIYKISSKETIEKLDQAILETTKSINGLNNMNNRIKKPLMINRVEARDINIHKSIV